MSSRRWWIGLAALLVLLILAAAAIWWRPSPTPTPPPPTSSPTTTPIPPTPTPTPLPTVTPSGDWQLVWSDEFNGPTIDQGKWSFNIGNSSGWGNAERQYYTDRPENARIEDGALVITALREDYQRLQYTSARLVTTDKGDWTYGRFEIRARLPYGQGIWPAIWLLPTDAQYGNWPMSGEVDIMELIGHEPGRVYGTLHWGNPHGSAGDHYDLPQGERFADDFHVFALEWEPGEMRWYVDGYHYQTQNEWFTSHVHGQYPAPFDQPFHFVINVAVGGFWPGYPDETTEFPQTMTIDYVRVYQR